MKIIEAILWAGVFLGGIIVCMIAATITCIRAPWSRA